MSKSKSNEPKGKSKKSRKSKEKFNIKTRTRTRTKNKRNVNPEKKGKTSRKRIVFEKQGETGGPRHDGDGVRIPASEENRERSNLTECRKVTSQVSACGVRLMI